MDGDGDGEEGEEGDADEAEEMEENGARRQAPPNVDELMALVEGVQYHSQYCPLLNASWSTLVQGLLYRYQASDVEGSGVVVVNKPRTRTTMNINITLP
eukprot:5674379-Pyramimonas_sp.AAC.1